MMKLLLFIIALTAVPVKCKRNIFNVVGEIGISHLNYQNSTNKSNTQIFITYLCSNA